MNKKEVIHYAHQQANKQLKEIENEKTRSNDL